MPASASLAHFYQQQRRTMTEFKSPTLLVGVDKVHLFHHVKSVSCMHSAIFGHVISTCYVTWQNASKHNRLLYGRTRLLFKNDGFI